MIYRDINDMDEYYCEEFNYKVLDKIDILPYIKKFKGKKVSSLIAELEEQYNSSEITDNDILQGYLFNYIGESEFADYLKKRYPNDFNYTEIVITYII